MRTKGVYLRRLWLKDDVAVAYYNSGNDKRELRVGGLLFHDSILNSILKRTQCMQVASIVRKA